MNDTALPGRINILENADRSVFPEMNDRMIIIFENESADSIGQPTGNQPVNSEGNMCIMSQYACSWPG